MSAKPGQTGHPGPNDCLGPVIGIESSCDETACAVLDPHGSILAEAVLSQQADHAPFGGVVPEIAARAHLAHLPAVGNVLASAVQGAVALLDRSRFGQSVSARTGPRFPLGYFMVAQRPVVAGAAVAVVG